MKSQRVTDGERTLAVFIDFENLALGFGNRRDRFNINKVLERLVEKGKIVAKKAYADWSRFGFFTTSLHEAAVELIEIPKRVITGKNSADIRMCVDAMDLAYSKDHIDTFVVVSGDSDFSPLVSKLKELGKHVIGLGLADSTSDLLRDNCDEFIYYEDLDRAPLVAIESDLSVPEQKRKLFALLLDSLLALKRENKEVIFSSMVKDTLKRKKPSFNEEYHGYRTFSDLLEDAARYNVIEIERHKASGTYVITRFGSDMRGAGQLLPPSVRTRALPAAPPLAESPPERRPEPPPRRPEPPERRPEPPRRQERPEPVARRPEPPRPVRPPVDDDAPGRRLPLGRELIDEIDDLDEIPSYRPQRPPTPRPVERPQERPQERVPERRAERRSERSPERDREPRREREPDREPRRDRPPERDREPEPRRERDRLPERDRDRTPRREPPARRPASLEDEFDAGIEF